MTAAPKTPAIIRLRMGGIEHFFARKFPQRSSRRLVGRDRHRNVISRRIPLQLLCVSALDAVAFTEDHGSRHKLTKSFDGDIRARRDDELVPDLAGPCCSAIQYATRGTAFPVYDIRADARSRRLIPDLDELER